MNLKKKENYFFKKEYLFDYNVQFLKFVPCEIYSQTNQQISEKKVQLPVGASGEKKNTGRISILQLESKSWHSSS